MAPSRFVHVLSLLFLFALLGCEDTRGPMDAGDLDAGSSQPDAADPPPDAGPVADTWTSFANDFMQRYCVSCHSTSPKDFNLLADVRTSSSTVRCGVTDVALDTCGAGPAPRQFPVGGGPFPTDEERARLVRWLDAGAPE